NSDPLLIAPAQGNFNLGAGSPAIDKGDAAAPSLPALDFAGNARIFGPAPDMGALEAVPVLAVTPASLDFGSVATGTRSTLPVTLTNSGAGTLTVTSLVLSDTTNYTIDPNFGPNPCGSLTPVVPGQGSCTIGIVFNPATDGTFNGTLTVNSDDPKIPTFVLPVTGSGGIGGVSGSGCALSGSEANFGGYYAALLGLGTGLAATVRRKIRSR